MHNIAGLVGVTMITALIFGLGMILVVKGVRLYTKKDFSKVGLWVFIFFWLFTLLESSPKGVPNYINGISLCLTLLAIIFWFSGIIVNKLKRS